MSTTSTTGTGTSMSTTTSSTTTFSTTTSTFSTTSTYSTSSSTTTTYPPSEEPHIEFKHDEITLEFKRDEVTLEFKRDVETLEFKEVIEVGNIPKVKNFFKQPYESMVPYASLEDQLESGETIDINNSTVTAKDKNGNAVTDILSGSPYVLDIYKYCQRVIAGEEAKSPYLITFRVQTSLNNKWEVDCKMKVGELV